MVRVIIERRCRLDTEAELQKLLMELRTKGMQQDGYISGETLWSVDDPSLWLVISTWHDIDSWKVWETSPERQQSASKMESLLIAPEKVSVFRSMR